MAKKLTNIRQRQIYWLDDCEPLDGDDHKDRPVIVLSPPESLAKDRIIVVVACSTHPRPRDNPRFLIPARETDPETGLPCQCWALPRWYLYMNRFRLTALKGNCPEPIFVPLLTAVLAEMKKDASSESGQKK